MLGYPAPNAGKPFARKVMRVIKANEEDIQNEGRALDVLMSNGHHDNIVDVLKHGWLETAGQVYFVDMELADLSLADYIKYAFHSGPLPEYCREFGPACPSRDCDKVTRLHATFVVGCQIARGLEYMHNLCQGHRDLKPSNGMCRT